MVGSPATSDSRKSTDIDADDELLRLILLAYPDRVVKRRGLPGTGVMVGGRGVCLTPDSVVRDADLFIAIDAREDRRAGVLEVQVSLASVVRLEWLEQLFPAHVRHQCDTRYDEPRQRVVSTNQLWYHDLLLREDTMASPQEELAASHLAQAIRPQAANIFRENQVAASWLSRVEFLKRTMPELNWPEFSDDVLADLLEDVCQGKSRLEEVQRADLVPYLQSRLTPAQNRELQQSAPLTLSLPSGRQARLTYEPGRPPILAVRSRNFSVGPNPRAWPMDEFPYSSTCSVQTIAPCKSPMI